MKPFRVTTKHRDLDLAWVAQALRGSYWGGWLTDDAIRTSVNNSLCFGAYCTETRAQIGFCRVITDRAVLSSLTDMIVAPEWRGKGVGSALLRLALGNPWVEPTICVLASRDARGFYTRFGFREAGGDVMLRSPKC